MVKNLPDNAEDMGFDPWSGNLPPPQLLKPLAGPALCKGSRHGGDPSPRGEETPLPPQGKLHAARRTQCSQKEMKINE